MDAIYPSTVIRGTFRSKRRLCSRLNSSCQLNTFSSPFSALAQETETGQKAFFLFPFHLIESPCSFDIQLTPARETINLVRFLSFLCFLLEKYQYYTCSSFVMRVSFSMYPIMAISLRNLAETSSHTYLNGISFGRRVERSACFLHERRSGNRPIRVEAQFAANWQVEDHQTSFSGNRTEKHR